MSCFEFGFTINNDVDDRLKKSVEFVAGYDRLKANILAGFVNSEEFLEFCKESEKFDASKSLADNHQNTVRSLLKQYFRDKCKSVKEYSTKQQAEALQGFSSVTAKYIGIDYTATMINACYNESLRQNNGNKKKINKTAVITQAMSDMEYSFIDNAAVPVFKSLETRDENFANAYNEVVKLRKQLTAINTNKTLNKKEKDKKLEEVNKKLQDARVKLFNLACNLVSAHGNVVQKNYMNIIVQAKANPNEWFNKAFESSKLVSIVESFKHTLESEKLIDENYVDENDYINPNSENVDESSKSWEDKIWASFDKSVAADLKLYFNSLFRLAEPCELGSKKYNYDRNNECGVPTTMGANFVISQLINYGNFNSVNEFIDSIIKMSKQVPELYGFIAIANRAVEDPVFANKLFTELANPKIIKTMAIIGESGIELSQSNKSADALSYVVYSMLNHTRSTMTDMYDEKDVTTINSLLDSTRRRNKGATIDFFKRPQREKNEERRKEYQAQVDAVKENMTNEIYNVLKKYYPKLSIVALKTYINHDADNVSKTMEELLGNIKDLLDNVSKVVDEYNRYTYDYNWAMGQWRHDKEAYLNATATDPYAKPYESIHPMPIRDLSKVSFEKLNRPIVNLAKKLVNYSAVKNELNSVNAEGNLASDVINNSWITNMLKQIAYGNEKDVDAGLNQLLNEVTKGEQYRYNPLFFGVRDSKGNLIKEGLFIRENGQQPRINPKARTIIQVTLFNGIKDSENSKAAMYDRMSKGDYFLTSLYYYKNPIGMGENVIMDGKTLKEQFAGYFMRTPSDAPKIFSVQAPKYKTEGIITSNAASKKNYKEKVKTRIKSFINHANAESHHEFFDNYTLGIKKVKKDQEWTAKEIYSLINSNEEESINYNNMVSFTEEDGSVTVPIIYKKDDDVIVFWINGTKLQGETNNILYDISLQDVTSSYDTLSDKFFDDIDDVIEAEGINNNEIQTNVNRNVEIFYALQQQLLGELNTYISQLTNVFEKRDGQWVLKTSTEGLIDRAHYNGTILENGKLTGNFFSFRRLFNTEGIDVQKLMEQQLSLYGGVNVGLIQVDRGNATINMEHSLIKEDNGRLVLNVTDELNKVLSDITATWINAFNREVIKRTAQYSKLTNERFNQSDVFDFMLNSVNAEISFDDVFEGDVKFYKNAQDFLKRAKEVQAGGKAYAGFSIDDALSQELKDVTDRNGNVCQIKIGDITIEDFVKAYSPVEGASTTPNARNGFRAITITNTVRPSRYATQIKEEMLEILKNKMDDAHAEKIAQKIYSGFAENTKTNDAQSYITIEEFIRRRWADGTLDQYKDILTQIYEVRTGKRTIEDINLDKINARIQVQKNFYFDKHFDTATQTHYPRQIKNAEFVLIPELLEGTQLKELYNIMTKYDIGQVNTAETSKAAKKNVLTFWDDNGNINPNFEQDVVKNSQAAIEDFYYRFLYKQQDVAEHMKNEQNKAGIQIMKKIIDNSDNPVLAEHVQTFFDNYCANIKEDFNRMIYSMGWKVNKDGSLSNIEGSREYLRNNYEEKYDFTIDDVREALRQLNVPINSMTEEELMSTAKEKHLIRETLDFTDFYEKARHEAQRLGLDEQFIDYITPNEFGNPIMPNYMNNVTSKLESIAQALFNSNITRQKLPGWHAAQVTQIGHGKKVLDDAGNLRELKYHPAVYKLKGGDEVIDAETYNSLSKEDKEKYEIKNEAYAEVLIPRWSSLIPKGKTAEEQQKILEQIQKEGLDIQIAYRIPTEGKQSVTIAKVVGFLDDCYGSTVMLPDEWVTQTGADFDVDSVYAICYEMWKDKEGNVHKWTAKNAGTDITKYKRYLLDNIDNKIPNAIEDPLHENKYAQLKKRLVKAAKERDYAEMNKIGKEAGLMSFNEFKGLDEIEKLPRQVRNNNILDAMVAIMSDINSREENYSRSNFDAITGAMKEMNDARGASSIARSTYNPLDQIDFMENAMSGASLKAFSVTRDTFNSVNNHVKGYLSASHGITVDYNLIEYDLQTIIDAYGEENTTLLNDKNEEVKEAKDATKVRVVHKNLANSKNNRNVVGELITVYSSQTTAHILDAIKEGAIYNENAYTFGTFKTLIDVGIDYRTAVAFLMQPAVTEINEVNNETNSIYTESGGNAVNNAIKRLASKAGYMYAGKPITDYTNFNSVMLLLNTDKRFQKVFKELFGAEINDLRPMDNVVFPLDVQRLKTRLNEGEILNISELSYAEDLNITDNFVNAVFDIGMCVLFNQIHNTTQSIEKIMRCSNPDRFGAKQTVRATRMIASNILAYGFDEINPVGQTILVNKEDAPNGRVNLLQAIYPGFNTKEGIDIKKSAYPYLAAFLKYSTKNSIDINSQLFPTENDDYTLITNSVQAKLGIIFNDEQYREYKQYMMMQVYASVPYISTPLITTEEGWFDIYENAVVGSSERNRHYWNTEISRVFGYDEQGSSNMEIEDLTKPTREELEEFTKLTPAQKVIFIQTNFSDDRGIFEYINVNKFNQYEYKNKGYTQQTIRFTDSVDNMVEVYLAFNNSFYSSNPLIRLATMDLIKYAFIVEGFKFKKGGLSKIITNNALYKNIEDMGLNIIPVIRNVFQNYCNPNEACTKEFIDRFIRSHSEYTKLIKFDKPDRRNGHSNTSAKFNDCLKASSNGLVYIPYDRQYEELLDAINIKVDETPKSYVRISKYVGKKTNRTSTLYKIDKRARGVYLIPLNLLERNEVSKYSVNPKYNTYPDVSYFEAIIEDAERNDTTAFELTKEGSETYAEYVKLKNESLIPNFEFNSVKESLENPNEFRRYVLNEEGKEVGRVEKFISFITDYVNSPVEERGKYAVAVTDSSYILSQVPKGVAVIQNIPTGKDVVTVRIKRIKAPRYIIDDVKNKTSRSIDSIPVEMRAAYKNAIEGNRLNASYFKIELVTDSEIKKKIEEQDRQDKEESAPDMAAITSDVSDFYVNDIDDFTIVDSTAKDMLVALKRAEELGNDKNAKRAREAINLLNINEDRSQDIIDNRKNIYSIVANYMDIYASTLNDKLTHYDIDGVTYDVGSDELYKALLENPKEAENIVRLLLEAITFGGAFGDIMTLPLEGVDEETTNAIKRIRNSINKIRNNISVKQGFKKMFNVYIANKYATNPNIRMGIEQLTDTFGDAGWWESWIGDIGMISNKQIQTVVKIVNNIMSEAVRQDAPKAKREFLKELDAILDKSGDFSWDNVVDEQGRLTRPFTAQFLEDRDRVRKAVQEAKDTYGIDSYEYAMAKLERDEWMAKNTHQMVVKEYYDRKNANIRKVLTRAPKEYIEYMRLTHELYNDDRPTGTLTKEEKNRRRALNRRMSSLLMEYNEDGSPKTVDAMERAGYLADFINERNKINNEYFETTEIEGFAETVQRHLDVINAYKRAHPHETLDQRLMNEDYKASHDWLNTNTRYTMDHGAYAELNEAFKVLKDVDNNKSAQIRAIVERADAIDDLGIIDARKLSEEDIAKIKEMTKHKYDFSYDSNAGEAILIKDIPTNLPALKDSFYRMLRAEGETEQNPTRLRVIARLNELLAKCVDRNTGHISAKAVFEDLTEDERKELAAGYRVLRNIKGKRKPKEIREKFKKNVSFEVNKPAFLEEYGWALTNLKGTKDFDVFIDIFVQKDANGEIQLDDDGTYTPNNDIYGYIVPKDDTYIDEEKTNARQLIAENVSFVPTEYYYASQREATNNGTFNEWFEKNHVYNPYTHKFEPLRVWTTMEINPDGKYRGKAHYEATYENRERSVKESKKNDAYNPYGLNYNESTGGYNNFVNLTAKEQEVRNFLQKQMDFFAEHNKSNRFIEQGFVPRKRKTVIDKSWYVQQAFGTLGLEYRNDSEDKWYEKVDFTNDRNADNDMLHLLKGKGYKELEQIRPRGIHETEEEYEAYKEAVKERNANIRAENLKIDNALMDKDYRTVFAEAIQQQVVRNAQNRAKNWLYLLQEDLKNNEAYAVSALTGKLVKDKRRSTDTNDRYTTTKQNRALESVEAFTRRVIFDQFKKRTPYNKYADLARNITSAKYMIFNVTGGIANVSTGFVNIMGEAFAKDNISSKELGESVAMYLKNSVAMLRDMYKDTSTNFAVALTKYFNVVDLDSMLERAPSETAGEYARRVRNLLYGLQSGGEHFMQNSVLFAVLKQSRIYNDVDGTKRCGTFQQYIWKTEYNTLLDMISNDELLLNNFMEFKRQIKTDKQELLKYDTFKRNIVEEFLRAYCTKDQINEYIAKRKEAIKRANEEWNKLAVAIDQFELGEDGYIHIKEGSEMTQDMVNQLTNTTVYLNKKIHGVYDKIGAARIEFSWWGGLVMQYHKHIYPGMMKRFRWKGYYNEQTETIEIGSYAALVRLLGREFIGIDSKIAARKEDGTLGAIASIQAFAKAAIDCIINIKTNWNLMPTWERNACRRALGDLYGIASAILFSMALYMMTDDDDEKNNEAIASLFYISDRCLSEAQMYTPWGLVSEAKTLWSSPIAATNGPEDLLKALGIIAGYMFDEDYDMNYKTGLYAGQNKLAVLLKRNIPLYRVVNRLSNMTKNNSYYRINEKSLNMKFAKSIADIIVPD